MKKTSIYMLILIAIGYSCTTNESDNITEDINSISNLSPDIDPKGRHLCGSDKLAEDVRYLELLKQENIIKSNTLNSENESLNRSGEIKIKVVINHIGDISLNPAISEAQARAIVAKLNVDFNKQNPKRSHIYSQYTSVEGDPNITFVYDSRRIRHKSVAERPHFNFDSWSSVRQIQDYAQGGITPKDPSRYLNIYLLDQTAGPSGLGISPFAANHFNVEEAVIFRTFRYYSNTLANAKEVMSHEVGHYFGLSHVFSSGTTCANGDFPVSDTPWQDGPKYEHCNDPRVGCETGKVYIRSNFMTYSYCMSMFTKQQVAIMRKSINDRPNLGY